VDSTTGMGANFVTAPNTDGDAQPNYLDIDADNDGIVDNIEGQSTVAYIAPSGTDSDNDGLDDAYDAISGIGGAGISPVNTDATDTPDYLDLDTDNDGISDNIEGWDTNGDGTAEVTASGADADNDGLDDAYDNNDSQSNPTNGQTPISFPNVQPQSASLADDRDWRTPPYLPPVAGDDTATTPINQPITGTLIGGDSSPIGLPLTYTPGTFPTQNGGTVVINPDGSYTYTPPANFVGTDCFTYTVCDNNTPTPGCATANLCITVTGEPTVTIPEGFSPNNDGVNDTFVIKGRNGRPMILRIYNRWGNLVYENENYQDDWNGISNFGVRVGEQLPDGTYFYTVEFKDNGERYTRYLTIKR
ncbi:MAG: gliding motility-associated C-terminal domain-containing protein, partial [Thermonemataceae bacterium]|nr:gliding motility-associated C-terminal domain-containing protein [Thermonemataceae bacterium]